MVKSTIAAFLGGGLLVFKFMIEGVGWTWFFIGVGLILYSLISATSGGPSQSFPVSKKRSKYNEREHFIYWNLFLNKHRRR